MNPGKSKISIITYLALLLPAITYSQKSDSSKTSKIKLNGICFSAGINKTQYYSNAFFNYLSNSIGAENPAQLGNYYYPSYVTSGSAIPNQITYSNLITGPAINLGLNVNSGRLKNIYLNHLLELSYMGISSNYSYSVNYEEVGYFSGFKIMDTARFNYRQNIVSLGYKFQPTYKFIFLSFGINCSFNFIKVNEHNKEQIYSVYENPEYPQKYYSTSNSTSDTTINTHFINLPFQVGVGGIIQINRIVLEPAFCVTSCFMKGYNIYNLSFGIEYNTKKK